MCVNGKLIGNHGRAKEWACHNRFSRLLKFHDRNRIQVMQVMNPTRHTPVMLVHWKVATHLRTTFCMDPSANLSFGRLKVVKTESCPEITYYCNSHFFIQQPQSLSVMGTLLIPNVPPIFVELRLVDLVGNDSYWKCIPYFIQIESCSPSILSCTT